MSSSHTPRDGHHQERHRDPRYGGLRNGDSLNGGRSVGSRTSIGSPHSTHANGKGSLWASTPLTSSGSSPPKVLSPLPSEARSKQQPNGLPHHLSSTSLSRPPSADATPLPSPPRDRKAARPPPGQAKGYRAVWDPELDSKLGKEEKRKMKPKLKHFGQEVRGHFIPMT